MSRFIEWLLRLPILQSTLPLTNGRFSYVTDDIPLSTLRQFRHACSVPLTTLLLDTELLAQSGENREKVTARVRVAAERLKDLFSISRTEVGSFTMVDLLDDIQKFFPENVEILNKSKIANFSLQGSKILFSEVILCLITNAIEAYLPAEKPHVIVHLSERLGVLEIKVTDSGQGMNSLELVLSQVDGVSFKKSGTGVGLPFCIEIIRNYFGGTLKIFSRKGMGTCVKIKVPTTVLLS